MKPRRKARPRLPRWVKMFLYLALWPSWNFRRHWWRLHANHYRSFREGGRPAAKKYATQAGLYYAWMSLTRIFSPRDWFFPGDTF